MFRKTASAADAVKAYQLMQGGRFVAALEFAERAAAAQHACAPEHGMLATILLQLGRASDAEQVVCQALECESGVADAYDALAHVSLLLGQYERSNALYRRVVKMEPREPRFWYNLASSERSFGRLIEAEAACDRAIALNPNEYGSYLLRSELRVQKPEENHVEELRAQLSRPGLQIRARTLLGYALAKELDDLECFDEAFRWFSEAAAMRRSQLQYDVRVDERKLRRIAEVFCRQITQPEIKHDRSSRFIFIVGLPRSGTTLLEHILTGLPGVRSNGETDNFSRALLAAAALVGEDVFARAVAADMSAVATGYERLAERGSETERIIEKLPINYLYVGAIRRALPKARILLIRRHPLDSCFAMYRTLFGTAYPFTYAFDELARYFVAYDRLISHWRDCYKESVFEVQYEELVEAPKRIGSRVADHCEIAWDPRAVEVHKSASVSLTASASQIRRPIYGSSSGRWRQYRAHLDPLIDALREYGFRGNT
jgi:tetratricopeptide (TPR) repeat protein